MTKVVRREEESEREKGREREGDTRHRRNSKIDNTLGVVTSVTYACEHDTKLIKRADVVARRPEEIVLPECGRRVVSYGNITFLILFGLVCRTL